MQKYKNKNFGVETTSKGWLRTCFEYTPCGTFLMLRSLSNSFGIPPMPIFYFAVRYVFFSIAILAEAPLRLAEMCMPANEVIFHNRRRRCQVWSLHESGGYTKFLLSFAGKNLHYLPLVPSAFGPKNTKCNMYELWTVTF